MTDELKNKIDEFLQNGKISEKTLNDILDRLEYRRSVLDWSGYGKQGLRFAAERAMKETIDVRSAAREKSDKEVLNETLDIAAVCIRLLEGDWK